MDSDQSPVSEPQIVVIGAGPAGLTAAYQLGKYGRTALIVEADDVVGGISRTAKRDGWRFDIGGHRFFTKVAPVSDLWHEILPAEDFLLRPRMSRIFYKGKFYDYPLKAFNALGNLGVLEAARCVLSYLWVQMRPPEDQTKFEGYVAAKFGWRLYRTFFKTYTEKVWGVPADQLEADWAAQRIKNLNLINAITNAIVPKRHSKGITSLIEEFEYPRHGPGMMWERCTELVEAQGSTVEFNAKVTGVRHANGVATGVVTTGPAGRQEHECSAIILIDAHTAACPSDGSAGTLRGPSRRCWAQVPRLSNRCVGRSARRWLPRQLDLYPLPPRSLLAVFRTLGPGPRR